MALFGVLVVNLLTGFRVSLFESIFTFHTHPGWANRVVDILMGWVFEFKAFAILSLMFGTGVGAQVERSGLRIPRASLFLARRFSVLLAIGLCHMLLIWNGDILALYAVCGLLLIPLVRMGAKGLVILGTAVVALSPYLPLFGAFLPTEAAMHAHAAVATRVYATGSFLEIMSLRFSEAGNFILPLLIHSLPRTLGLMLLGIGGWRSGVLERPGEHRHLLKVVLVVSGSLGAAVTTVHVWSKDTGQPAPLGWLDSHSVVLLALAYCAGLLLWLSSGTHGVGWLTRRLADAGRMALTNYLAQSVIFSLLFYGFGLGLFGKVGSASAVLFGVAVFAGQLVVSEWWLQRFCFGPAEWLWRSLAYGRCQPFVLNCSRIAMSDSRR